MKLHHSFSLMKTMGFQGRVFKTKLFKWSPRQKGILIRHKTDLEPKTIGRRKGSTTFSNHTITHCPSFRLLYARASHLSVLLAKRHLLIYESWEISLFSSYHQTAVQTIFWKMKPKYRATVAQHLYSALTASIHQRWGKLLGL